MKKSMLMVLSSVLFSSLGWASDGDSWEVKTTEKQFEVSNIMERQTYTLEHLSLAAKANIVPSTHTDKKAMSKGMVNRAEAKDYAPGFWIFDAWVEFYRDDDGDGYFNRFAIEFDADTDFDSALVYARLYLGQDEVFREFHTTSDFSIYADSSDDSFVVESELINGFNPADYEVLIELYDAYSHEIVAAYDGNNDADLYLLSLESQEYEVTQVVVVTEHGGSIGIWGLLLLPWIVLRGVFTKAKF